MPTGDACCSTQLEEIAEAIGVHKMSMRKVRTGRANEVYNGETDVRELSIQGMHSLHPRARLAVFEQMIANRTDQAFQGGRRTPSQLQDDRRLEHNEALRKGGGKASREHERPAMQQQEQAGRSSSTGGMSSNSELQPQQTSWQQEQHRLNEQQWQQEQSWQQGQAWQWKKGWQQEQDWQQEQGWQKGQQQQHEQSWRDLSGTADTAASSSGHLQMPAHVPLPSLLSWGSSAAATDSLTHRASGAQLCARGRHPLTWVVAIKSVVFTSLYACTHGCLHACMLA